jgi:sec-independent protein translocase protein TatA
MLGIGRFGEILLIILLILILFGAGKLPSVMSDLARGLRAFRQNIDGKNGITYRKKTKYRNKGAYKNKMEHKNDIDTNFNQETVLPISSFNIDRNKEKIKKSGDLRNENTNKSINYKKNNAKMLRSKTR